MELRVAIEVDTGRAGVRKKACALQIESGASQRASEVVLGFGVVARKAGTSQPEDGLDLCSGYAAMQQFFGDPEVGDAPIGLGEALQDTQAVEEAMIDGGSVRCWSPRIDGTRTPALPPWPPRLRRRPWPPPPSTPSCECQSRLLYRTCASFRRGSGRTRGNSNTHRYVLSPFLVGGSTHTHRFKARVPDQTRFRPQLLQSGNDLCHSPPVRMVSCSN